MQLLMENRLLINPDYPRHLSKLDFGVYKKNTGAKLKTCRLIGQFDKKLAELKMKLR